jgi:hypothetical protein
MSEQLQFDLVPSFTHAEERTGAYPKDVTNERLDGIKRKMAEIQLERVRAHNVSRQSR